MWKKNKNRNQTQMSLVSRAKAKRSMSWPRTVLQIERMENRILPSCIRDFSLNGRDWLPGGWTWVDPSQRFQNVAGVITEMGEDDSWTSSDVSHTDFPSIHDSHDWNAPLQVDPPYRNLLTSGNEYGIIELEWETGTWPHEQGPHTGDHILPKWVWPSFGDRVWVNGNWVLDCGHSAGPARENAAEIHPPRAIATMRHQFLPMPGTGAVPVAVTATDLFIHGDGGFATDVLYCGQRISISGVRDSHGDDRCETHTNPIADDYEFDILLPRNPGGNAVLTTSVDVGPGNTIANFDPILTPLPDQQKVHVKIPLKHSGAHDLDTYARRINAGWIAVTDDVHHLRLTLNSMKVNDTKEGGGTGGLTFFFLNVPNAPQHEWIRLVDYATNPVHMNRFGRGETEGFIGATWDFYSSFLAINANGFEQKSLDDDFGDHHGGLGHLLSMAWKYLWGNEDAAYNDILSFGNLDSGTWTVANPHDEYELTFTTQDIPLQPQERTLPSLRLLVSGVPTGLTAGDVSTITVTAADPDGNPITGFHDTVHFTSTDPAATLPADYTFSPSIDLGRHTWTNGIIFRTAGTHLLTVTDRDNGTMRAIWIVTVLPGPLHDLALSGIPSTLPAGTPADVTVTAEDRFHNPIPTYRGTVHFGCTDHDSTVPPDYAFTAADGGRHLWPNGLILRNSGIFLVMVSDNSSPPLADLLSITVPPIVATSLVLDVPPLLFAGTPATIQVTAQDRFGHVATNYRGTVHLTVTDGAGIRPVDYTFTASDFGTHTFTNGLTLYTAGAQGTTVTDTNNSSLTATSLSVVYPGEINTFLFADISFPLTAGVASDLTLVPLDRYGNAATGYRGRVHFSSSDPAAVLPDDYTFQNRGFHTWENGLALFQAGHPTLTATDVSPGGISSGGSVTVEPASPVAFSLTDLPPHVTAGTATDVTVTPRDRYGNAVTWYQGIVHFTSTDPTAQLPDDYTFTADDNGAHTFTSLVLRTAGNRTVTVTDVVAGGLTGSATVQVDPAAASVILVQDFPSPTTAGAGGAFRVTAFDLYGNLATTYSGTVHFTSTDGQAFLPPDYAFIAADNGSHLFNAVLYTAGTQALTATDTASSTLTGTQTGLVATPDVPSTLWLDAPAVVSAGAPFAVTVSVYDSYGNLATGYLGTVTFASSDSLALLPGTYSFTPDDGGSHTFTGVTLFTAGDQSLLVSDLDSGLVASIIITVGTGPGGSALSRNRPGLPLGTQPVLPPESARRTAEKGRWPLPAPPASLLPASAPPASESDLWALGVPFLDRFLTGPHRISRRAELIRLGAAALDDYESDLVFSGLIW